MRTILIIGLIFVIACFSLFTARTSFNSDFPVFYAAAKKILEPQTPNSSVYDVSRLSSYKAPETCSKEKTFIYSVAAAYLLAPLALMPYFTAKATMIFINIVLYLASIALILRFKEASGRQFTYPLFLGWLWFPFVQGIRGGQVNAVILFLIILAAYSAAKERIVFSGLLLAAAALFKLFPLAIAMALGVKNWRISAYCALFFVISLLIPGSLRWFAAIGHIYKADSMFTYSLLEGGSFALPAALYIAAVTGFTAAILYRYRYTDYLLLVAFTIPAAFLLMPIVEYHHLTLLIFSYVCLLPPSNKESRWLLRIALLSFIIIDASLLVSRQSYLLVEPVASKVLINLGLFLCWSAMAWKIHSVGLRTFLEGRSDTI